MNTGTLSSRFALPIALAAVFALMSLPGNVLAQGPNEYAKIVTHLVTTAQAGRNPCASSKATPKCSEMVTKGTLFPETYYAFICVTDGDRSVGIAGMQFGIEYNSATNQGVDIWEWTMCAALEFPQPAPPWPSSRGGNLITWDGANACERDEPGGSGTGVTAVAGYFYMTAYTPDVLKITVRPVDGLAKVADCEAFESILEGPGAPVFPKSHLGFASFSEGATVAGYNPCGIAKPVQDATWGEVKNHEKN